MKPLPHRCHVIQYRFYDVFSRAGTRNNVVAWWRWRQRPGARRRADGRRARIATAQNQVHGRERPGCPVHRGRRGGGADDRDVQRSHRPRQKRLRLTFQHTFHENRSVPPRGPISLKLYFQRYNSFILHSSPPLADSGAYTQKKRLLRYTKKLLREQFLMVGFERAN